MFKMIENPANADYIVIAISILLIVIGIFEATNFLRLRRFYDKKNLVYDSITAFTKSLKEHDSNTFKAKCLFTDEEEYFFNTINEWIEKEGANELKVYPKVSLCNFVGVTDFRERSEELLEDVERLLRFRYIDFLIVGKNNRPVAAIFLEEPDYRKDSDVRAEIDICCSILCAARIEYIVATTDLDYVELSRRIVENALSSFVYMPVPKRDKSKDGSKNNSKEKDNLDNISFIGEWFNNN